jgi:hypothetical protein
VFSPCGVLPDGVGNEKQRAEFAAWKGKQLVTPPIEIEIVGEE